MLKCGRYPCMLCLRDRFLGAALSGNSVFTGSGPRQEWGISCWIQREFNKYLLSNKYLLCQVLPCALGTGDDSGTSLLCKSSQPREGQ